MTHQKQNHNEIEIKRHDEREKKQYKKFFFSKLSSFFFTKSSSPPQFVEKLFISFCFLFYFIFRICTKISLYHAELTPKISPGLPINLLVLVISLSFYYNPPLVTNVIYSSLANSKSFSKF